MTVGKIKKANWGRKREGSGRVCKGPVEGTEARKSVQQDDAREADSGGPGWVSQAVSKFWYLS